MIYIVTPVFNRLKFTSALLESLNYQSIHDFKIIVIDHGSTDNTSEYIKANFPDVILLHGDSNMWWTAATNVGIVKALELSDSSRDFVLTLNNDLVVNADYLEELLKVYKYKNPCVVGSLSVDIDNLDKIDYSGGTWSPITAKYRKNNVTCSISELQKENMFLVTDLLPGRGTLFPIQVFKEIGMFDEVNFPHYAADEDFALQCKKNGYELLVSTKAIVKSSITSTGINLKYKRVSLKEFIKSLNSIRSTNNITIRWRWAKKNSSFPPLYFVFDTSRILFSFFRSLVIKR